jgi:hypothetical protein
MFSARFLRLLDVPYAFSYGFGEGLPPDFPKGSVAVPQGFPTDFRLFSYMFSAWLLRFLEVSYLSYGFGEGLPPDFPRGSLAAP